MGIKTITAGELLELAQQLVAEHGEDMKVVTSAPAGDYWKNTLANRIDKRDVDCRYIKYSEYHRAYAVDDNDEEDESMEYVIVL